MISFIFPSDFLNNKIVDSAYKEEYSAFIKNGFNVYLINIDDLDNSKINPALNINDVLIYRGWMLSKENYIKLYNKTNHQLKINPEEYIYSHHLPNWYNEIKELTIESYITTEENMKIKFLETGWSNAFVKDYVKSLKTGKGSVVDSEKDLSRAIEDIKKYKGFVEGGIILRKVMNFKNETEKRFFVLNGKVYSNEENEEMFKLAEKTIEKHNAFFYSVDIIRDELNKCHIIEIGDGQVSDMVGWDIENFTNIFKNIKLSKKMKI
jgi:hypothetical protein